MKLLDTTFLIHYWAGKNAVKEYLDAHEDTEEFVTTTINIKEIAIGRELQGKFDRQEICSKFNWVRIVPFSTEHSFLAGQLEATLRAETDINQDKINSLGGDILIAAVAQDVTAPIVTRNVGDFELFENVSVETY